MDKHLVRVQFYVILGDHDEALIKEETLPLSRARFKIPETPADFKEHGVDKTDYIVVDVFKKLEE